LKKIDQRFDEIDRRFDEMKNYIDEGLDKVVKEVAQEFRSVTDFIYERQNEKFAELDKKIDEKSAELVNKIKEGAKQFEKAVS